MTVSLETDLSRRMILLGLSTITLGSVLPVRAASDVRAVAHNMNYSELTRSYLADSQVHMLRGGKSRVRELRIGVIQQGNSFNSQRRFSFLAPSDIKGTSLLIREKNESTSDTWLYLPSSNRPRRISSSKQSGSFVGTDFSYADLTVMQLNNYDHIIVDQAGNNIILESVVKTKKYARNIGYSKTVTTLDARSFVPSRVEYYDLKGRHFKTQTMSGAVQTPEGRFILRTRVMRLVGKDKQTRIQMTSPNFSAALSQADFKPERLSRAF